MILKYASIKLKNDKLDFTDIQIFCSAKVTVTKIRREAKD